jgi:hypothetical protein
LIASVRNLLQRRVWNCGPAIRRRAGGPSTHYSDAADLRRCAAMIVYSCIRCVRYLLGLYRLADTVFAGT